MICIPLTAPSNHILLDHIARSESEPAALLELRLDGLEEPPEVERLVAAAKTPVIVTCRARDEGGGYGGTAEERRAILRRAAAAGAAYVDCETDDVDSLDGFADLTRIVSLHDFATTPADLDAKVDALCATRAEWVKFAVAARRHADNLRVFAALERCRKPAIGIAMDAAGLPSRLLGGRFGSRMAFGSLADDMESAPGQTTAATLAALYRVDALTARTRLCGYLDFPRGSGAEHAIYNRAFARAGLDAMCVPLLTDDAPDALDALPNALGFVAVIVSPRHAAAAFAWADEATSAAKRGGVANLLMRKGNGWIADDTGGTVPEATILEMMR